MLMSRRHFLGLSALVTIQAIRSPATFAIQSDEVNRYRLVLKPEQKHWFDEAEDPIELWGFNVSELRLEQGKPVSIEVVNRLPVPTSVHWHGLRIPNNMDGVSGLTQQPIPAGGSFIYEFTPKDAGTFWAHSHHQTYEQLARGLYIPLIVEETPQQSFNQDITLTFDDWRINQQGQLDLETIGDLREWAHGGRVGNLITTNRELAPNYELYRGQPIRLRLINVANARIFQLQLPEAEVALIAKDGQPLRTPVSQSEPLILAPAERYDLVIHCDGDTSNRLSIGEIGRDEVIDIVTFDVLDADEDSSKVFIALPVNPLPAQPLGEPVVRHSITMSGGAMGSLRQATFKGEELSIDELIQQRQIWAFNGVANMPKEPIFTVNSGEVVEITLINDTRWPHSMHLHGHHFLADLNRYPEGAWHDTLVMASGEEARIRFVADAAGDWLIHCHMIEHQAGGMVSWFRVTA